MKCDLRSRKFIFASVGIVSLFIGWVVCGLWPTLSSNFPILKDGIVMIVGAYMGGNIGHHFASAYENGKKTGSNGVDDNVKPTNGQLDTHQ